MPPLTTRELGQPGLSYRPCGHGIQQSRGDIWSTEEQNGLTGAPLTLCPDMRSSSEAAAVLEKRLALPQ